MRLYLDTSAAMKLVVGEEESTSLAATLESLDADDQLVSSWLHTELHCAAGRRREEDMVDTITGVLERLTLIDLLRIDLVNALRQAAGLRSQDALHLAVAVRTGADTIITYDQEQAAVASSLGMRVLQPR